MIRNLKATSENSFEWIDVIHPTEDELNSLAEKHNLPRSAVIDCLQPEHLPKFEQFENCNFIIIRYYDNLCKLESDSLHTLTRKVAIFYNDKYLITIHRGETNVIDEMIALQLQDVNYNSTINLICKLIKNGLQTFEKSVLKLERDVDHYESKIFLKNKIPNLLKTFYLIKRQSSVFKRTFLLSKSVIDQFGFDIGKNTYLEDLKDYYVRIEVMNEEIVESIAGLMHIYISLSSQKTNEVMRILTVFSAFFLPLTFIVGVYGMNFEFMPELKQPYGYPALMVTMLLITIFIFQWFKRKRWL
ncbi:MAG: CorA family divalent cation transporter [Cytophagales bacterium]